LYSISEKLGYILRPSLQLFAGLNRQARFRVSNDLKIAGRQENRTAVLAQLPSSKIYDYSHHHTSHTTMASTPTDIEKLESEWENSPAKEILHRLVEDALDKKEGGGSIRADVLYKTRQEFKVVPQMFFTKKLQKLRKSRGKEPDFEEIVSFEELEEEWENSSAKVDLEKLVEDGDDKKADSSNQRADAVYKMREDFKHFPLKYFTKKLQKLRKGKATTHQFDPELVQQWENSRARVILQRIVEHGLDCKDDGKNKTSEEIYKMNEEFNNFPRPFITQQLKLMRKGKPKAPSWKNSLARAILEELILVGLDRDEDGNDLPVLTIYEMEEEFKKFPLKNFSINLEALRESVQKSADKSLRDSLAVDGFLNTHPSSNMDAPRFNYERYPQWQGSDAQRLLREDLKVLLHHKLLFKGKDGVTPKLLWLFRSEYHLDFPLVVFRNHIYKEIIHDKQVTWNQQRKKALRVALK
jgi:hypothetical protein